VETRKRMLTFKKTLNNFSNIGKKVKKDKILFIAQIFYIFPKIKYWFLLSKYNIFFENDLINNQYFFNFLKIYINQNNIKISFGNGTIPKDVSFIILQFIEDKSLNCIDNTIKIDENVDIKHILQILITKQSSDLNSYICYTNKEDEKIFFLIYKIFMFFKYNLSEFFVHDVQNKHIQSQYDNTFYYISKPPYKIHASNDFSITSLMIFFIDDYAKKNMYNKKL
jgi:hypothetical protein